MPTSAVAFVPLWTTMPSPSALRKAAANLNVANGNIVIVQRLMLDKTETSDFTERDLNHHHLLSGWQRARTPPEPYGANPVSVAGVGPKKEATAPSRPAIPPTLSGVE